MDRWGQPVETLEAGGDCEDFAFLKLVSLELLGWKPEQLYILIGTTDRSGKSEGHALLMAVLPDGSQLLLDSMTRVVLPPADDHPFHPIYAIDRDRYYHVAILEEGDLE